MYFTLRQIVTAIIIGYLLVGCSKDRESESTTSAMPATPGNVQVIAGEQQNTLSWAAVSGATRYNVYWSTTAGMGKNATKQASVSSPYVHRGLQAGTAYYYGVTAENESGESEISLEVSAIPTFGLPDAPTGFSAQPDDSQVTLTWNTDASITYHLYWSNTENTGVAGTKFSNVTSPYVHTALVNGSAYYYVLTAENATGEGLPSTEISTTPSLSVPSAPTGLTAVAGDNLVTLRWDGGLDLYTIYWSTSPGAGRTANSFQVLQSPVPHVATNGTTYYYTVAVAGGELSAEVAVTPRSARPLNFTVHALSKAAELSWLESNATSYNVYYASDAGLDPDNIAGFSNGTVITNVSSPLTITGLQNGIGYYFILEGVGETTLRSSAIPARPDVLGFNSIVQAIDVHSNGTRFLGGRFKRVGATTGNVVPLNISNGDLASADFPQFNDIVHEMVVDGNGGYYAGGKFSGLDGIVRNRLVHILPDGSLDQNFNPNVNGEVLILNFDGSTLYIGGRFTQIDGVTRNKLASLTTDGVLNDWDPDISGIGASASVSSILVVDSTVYVGGNFNSVGGNARSNLAAIDANGLVTDWQPAADDIVHVLHRFGDNIIIGGKFTSLDATPRNAVAMIDLNGVLVDWNPDLYSSAAAEVYDIASSTDIIYLAGKFTVIGSRQYIAAFNLDGSLNEWWANTDKPVNAIELVGDTLYIAGWFSKVLNAPRNGIAAIGVDSVVKDWQATVNIEATSLFFDGSNLHVSSKSALHDGVAREGLAAINSDTSLSDWHPVADSYINSVLAHTDRVYVIGDFENINNQPRMNLAAIGLDGNLSAWNPQLTNSLSTNIPAMYDMEAIGDVVYMGGSFSHIDNISRSNLVAFNADGSLNPWNVPANGPVSLIASEGNLLYIYGPFTEIDLQMRGAGLAAVGTNGSLAEWNPTASHYDIYAMEVSGGTVYVGGTFATLGEQTRQHLGAYGLDGVLTDWNPSTTTLVSAIGVLGGNIYVGGFAPGVGPDSLQRLDTAGAVQTVSQVNNRVTEITSANGLLYVGGYFSRVGIHSRGGFAVLDSNGQVVQ